MQFLFEVVLQAIFEGIYHASKTVFWSGLGLVVFVGYLCL